MMAVLHDGTAVRVRPVRDGDGPGLRALLRRLPPRSRVLRFLDAGADLDRKAGWAASQGAGRGFGLGGVLLAELAAAAQGAGPRTLTAMVHPENRRIVALLRGCGLPLTESRRPGRLWFTLRLPTRPEELS